MDYLEILRKNGRPDGVIIAENKTNSDNSFTLARSINIDSQPLSTGWEINKNYYLNALDKSNYVMINEKFYNQQDILTNNNNHFLEKNKFIDFYLLMIATKGTHGAQFGDRRYYYNIILDKIEPIYYDWKPNLVLNDPSVEIFNPIQYEFKDKEIDNLIKKIENLKFLNMNEELNKKGFLINKEDLLSLKKKLTDNLQMIKKIPNSKNNSKFVNYEYPNYLLFHKESNIYELCDIKNICEEIIIKDKMDKAFLKDHEFLYGKKKIKYIRKKKDFFSKNKPPEKYNSNNMSKISLNDESMLYYNQHVNVIKKKDILDINYLNNNGRVYLIGGKISDYKFLINSNYNEYKNEIFNESNYLIGENYIPYGLIFYDIEILNVEIKGENFKNCLKSVRFIKSKGTIKLVKIINSEGDALSAELSDLEFVEVNIDKSNDDCLDFESGNYVFKNLNLSNCMDKGFQIKKK